VVRCPAAALWTCSGSRLGFFALTARREAASRSHLGETFAGDGHWLRSSVQNRADADRIASYQPVTSEARGISPGVWPAFLQFPYDFDEPRDASHPKCSPLESGLCASVIPRNDNQSQTGYHCQKADIVRPSRPSSPMQSLLAVRILLRKV
jgi:hypothetical protein